MGDDRNWVELRDDAVAAYEDSVVSWSDESLPSDYQMGVITAGAKEMTGEYDGSD